MECRLEGRSSSRQHYRIRYLVDVGVGRGWYLEMPSNWSERSWFDRMGMAWLGSRLRLGEIDCLEGWLFQASWSAFAVVRGDLLLQIQYCT